MGLSNEACIPCQDGGPTLNADELSDLLDELPGWEVVDGHHLHRVWNFKNFILALEWVRKAGAICEEQGHHADFKLGWGYAEAIIYTHKSDGLTRSDMVLAARLNALEHDGEGHA